MRYETVIGLEIHAELLTNSKIFCSCGTSFGAEPNSQVCPVCTGMPGSLPVLNKQVVNLAIKAGLAFNCTIANHLKFDRKNYFYPDLPKAYQISQYDIPLCKDGYVEIDIDGKQKKIGISQIHIEEDAGKLIHSEEGKTFVDFNRCGVGLIEIVTCPDIRSAQEAKLVFEEVKAILEVVNVSDCKMQEGSLRCDVNLSVRQEGKKELGERTEIKNLNSFSSVAHAIKSESERQIKLLENGERVLRQTRRWDDLKNKNTLLRSKEILDDYRFFSEPDLPAINIEKNLISEINALLPELPRARKLRFMNDFDLPEFDAYLIAYTKFFSDFFEKVVLLGAEPKRASSLLITDVQKYIKEKKLLNIPIEPLKFAKLIDMIQNAELSLRASKQVLEIMLETGGAPDDIAKEQGLIQESDEDVLLPVIQKVLQENQSAVADYKSGKEKAIGYIAGIIMKETRGAANPKVINRILKEILSK